jgi:hypothetical protein
LAARRAYTGDPSAVVILRTLIDNEELACRKKQGSAMIGGVIFFRASRKLAYLERRFAQRAGRAGLEQFVAPPLS